MKHFLRRFADCQSELYALYTSLYGSGTHTSLCFDNLTAAMESFYIQRSEVDKKRDCVREKNPQWFYSAGRCGMMLYVDLFAGTLHSLTKRIDYFTELGITYIHLMPLLKMPDGENDGGYAVSDYRRVHEKYGTIEDLRDFCAVCQTKDISVCLDFVINHTSDEHEWAQSVLAGEATYRDRYFCFESPDIPNQYEQTVPEVFPSTAPGSFTFYPHIGSYVMTSFYPYQWDLNFQNPLVLNEMISNVLFLANCGVDVFRIDAVPYIWKKLGSSCRNLPEVHSIMRLFYLVCSVVCPAIILKGEVVMAPSEVAPYFGSSEKRECHVLYNVTGMVSIWNTLATRDTRVLHKQMQEAAALPHEYAFIQYVRCHDDIGWGLDEGFVSSLGFNPLMHKEFLYHFYSGQYSHSFARGELYNYDPDTKDARSCGTCASLCGIEEARKNNDPFALLLSEARHILAHAFILSQSGIPVIYSGDELALENDYSYKQDSLKAKDSRYVHRVNQTDDMRAARFNEHTTCARIFSALKHLIRIRTAFCVFDADARVHVSPLTDTRLVMFCREKNGESLVFLYNFTEHYCDYFLDAAYTDIFSNTDYEALIRVQPYQFLWLKQK